MNNLILTVEIASLNVSAVPIALQQSVNLMVYKSIVKPFRLPRNTLMLVAKPDWNSTTAVILGSTNNDQTIEIER